MGACCPSCGAACAASAASCAACGAACGAIIAASAASAARGSGGANGYGRSVLTPKKRLALLMLVGAFLIALGVVWAVSGNAK